MLAVEPAGTADVFDLSVDHPDHAFVVNGGLVAHNCYDALRYALMHVGTAPSFVFDDTDPAELEHAPHGRWTELPDPSKPDWSADRDERAGRTAESPFAPRKG